MPVEEALREDLSEEQSEVNKEAAEQSKSDASVQNNNSSKLSSSRPERVCKNTASTLVALAYADERITDLNLFKVAAAEQQQQAAAAAATDNDTAILDKTDDSNATANSTAQADQPLVGLTSQRYLSIFRHTIVCLFLFQYVNLNTSIYRYRLEYRKPKYRNSL